MKQPYNLDREFIKWFYEEVYPEHGSNRAQSQAMGMPIANIDIRDYWMRQAYKAGARSMANETRCILGDWATACSGLGPELVTPDEIFDRAEQNLECYYNEVFKE